jgi:Peptidase propeptide and YPEB domain
MAARVLIAMLVAAAAFAGPVFAQTQPTRPSAYATVPTIPSAFATAALSPCYPSRRYFGYFDVAPVRRGFFDPNSPCYSGTIYPAYSAVTPFEFPKPTPKSEVPGSESLNADEAKSRIEAKGYLELSGLEKDSRGIWRGKGTMKDGRPVNVTLDLEGNIYSTLSRLYIRIEPPPANR